MPLRMTSNATPVSANTASHMFACPATAAASTTTLTITENATFCRMIASVRRDYLRHVMNGEISSRILDPATLPGKTEMIDGFVWLPRILVKARAKLRGELDPDTMFCCGGDRRFLREHDLAPADFLRAVWAAEDDDTKVIEYVKKYSGS